MDVRSFEGCVQATGQHILLDLSVPLIGRELREPMGESAKLGSREGGHHGLKFFDARARTISLAPVSDKKRLSDWLSADAFLDFTAD